MSTAALTAAVACAPPWRDLVALLKLRIATLVVATAAAAAVGAGSRDPLELAVLALGCLAAAGGAGAINHYLDRDLDARMRRTASRPLPSGRIGDPRVALWLGWSLVAASTLSALVLGLLPAAYLVAGALTYALLYTRWLKRRTPYSIVFGGAAGSFAALAGWQTAGSTWAPAPLLLAAVLFLWTPSHFWSLAIVLERDYREAGVPMLSAVAGVRRTAAAVHANTIGLVAASLVLAFFVAWPYAALAVPAGGAFMTATARLRRDVTTERAWTAFKLSGAYLLALLVGLALTTLA